MSDDLFDHYAREFATAAARRRPVPAVALVPVVATLAVAAVLAASLPGGGGPAEREAAPRPATAPVTEVGPPPARLRDETIGFVDRTGRRGGVGFAQASLLHAGWKTARRTPVLASVATTVVFHGPGRREDAELLARALGIDRVFAGRPRHPLTVVVGRRGAFDDAFRVASATFGVLDETGRAVVRTRNGPVGIEVGGAQLCLLVGTCTELRRTLKTGLAHIQGFRGPRQPFRAVGLVPDGIDHVVFHGRRIPVRDNVWAAPASRGPRAVTVPGMGVVRIGTFSAGP